RILPQHAQGEVTFEHMARYGTDYRDQLPDPIYVEPVVYYTLKGSSDLDYLRWDWQKTAPQSLKSLWVGVFLSGLGGIVLLILAIFLGL
ncbi:MAG: phycobilisome rod-core linker polypeptide CpcG, partial [Cyanobacteria bacterium J06635_11]